MLEALESRWMLSLMMTVEKGILIVQGTTGNDTIIADQTDTSVAVTVNDYGFTAPKSVVKGIRIMADKGNDVITVNPTVRVQALIYGGPGNDRLTGSDVKCRLSGDAGNDLLRPGSGKDIIAGGPGIDVADYSLRSDPLVITLDNKPNDGRFAGGGKAAESDNVMADCEIIRGGSGDDKLYGNALANTLVGGAGSDSLYGLAGNDVLSGRLGADSLDGGDGDDVMLDIDLAADDTLSGGAGNDSYAIDSVLGRPDTVLGCEVELSVLET